MANGRELDSVRDRVGRPPVYTHRAFSPIVAAWFAALLGVGSLTFPASTIGRIFETSGISALIPATAGPLGFAARATIAIASALAGTALGLSLARRVIRSAGASAESRSVAPRCRPIDVLEDLGAEGIGEVGSRDHCIEDIALHREPTITSGHSTIEAAEPAPAREPSLDDLGLMQLTARLGATLERRRRRDTARERVAPPTGQMHPADFGEFESSDPHEAARAIADFFAPATPNRIGEDEWGALSDPAEDSIAPPPASSPSRSRPKTAERSSTRLGGDGQAAARNLRATLAILEGQSGDA